MAAHRDRFDVANALREIGLLLNLSGNNPYKARAYINGASALESLSDNLDEMVKDDRLTDIPGIGEALAASIREYYQTGALETLTRLKVDLPAGVIELSEIPGLTLKRIRALYDTLNIQSIEDLIAACESHRVAKIKGFGAKTETTILESVRNHQSNRKNVLLLDARETATRLVKFLKSKSGVKNIEIAGDVRRWFEVIDTISIVAEIDNAKKLFKTLENFPQVVDVIEQTADSCRVRLVDGLVVELSAVANLATGLIEHTGSSKHVEQLRDLAKDKGYTLTSAGLKKGKRAVTAATEADIYKELGLSYIPPEMREGSGEIEEAQTDDFADLITIEDMRGMTHCHTTYSDGTYSIKDMVLAAEKLGMQYITITDHSPLASYAGGLTLDRLKQQWEEIDEVQEQVKIRILKGTECDILADGKLDYSDAVLSKFDLIIASIHNRFRLDDKEMTKRVLRAIKDRHFKVWGHPLGRLLLRRPPIECDVLKILDAVADSRAAIEINADPYRLDLAPEWVRAARERNIKIIISTDAHSTRDYQNLEYGIHMARRAGVRRQEVLNTMPVSKFVAAVKPGK